MVGSKYKFDGKSTQNKITNQSFQLLEEYSGKCQAKRLWVIHLPHLGENDLL